MNKQKLTSQHASPPHQRTRWTSWAGWVARATRSIAPPLLDWSDRSDCSLRKPRSHWIRWGWTDWTRRVRSVQWLQWTVFPPACRSCNRLLNLRKAGMAGFPYLCNPCYEALGWQDPARHCLGCAQPTAEHHRRSCAACAGVSRAVEQIRAVFSHQGMIRRWIVGLKYYRSEGTARMLGALLARRLAETLEAHRPGEGIRWVVPVPLHKSRVQQRGFNQSLLLAHHALRTLGAARQHGASAAALPRLYPGLLQRHRRTRPQVDLSVEDRGNNVAAAFSVPRTVTAPGLWGFAGVLHQAPAALLKDSQILLVDDVMTTGATLDAAARALRDAGAQRVDALVLARA